MSKVGYFKECPVFCARVRFLQNFLRNITGSEVIASIKGVV